MRSARLLASLLPLATFFVLPSPAAAASHEVRITSAVEPASLAIAPGDTVTFRNADDVRHRMRSRSDLGEFDTGDLEPGGTFRVTFRAQGTFSYIDERDDDDHSYWGTIVVTAGGPAPGDGAGSGGTTGGRTTGGAGVTDAAGRATIGMAGRQFGPRSVTIAAGGTVTWRNDDDREHTATSSDGAFDSGVLAPGDSHRARFPAPGSFSFLCLIHPDMTGTVTVTAGAAVPAPAATPRPAAPSSMPAASPLASSPAASSAGATATPAATGTGEPVAAAGGSGPAAAAEAGVASVTDSMVGTLIALALIGGSLMVGTGLVLGVVHRGDGSAGAAGLP
ncbi:MAG TPA: cupredoxin domain-containing protein [Candidatus Limnocylindrales bacterium]|nr:cupredoxin domain-containing protein [Candidatus Limnocylindrales bacterium]